MSAESARADNPRVTAARMRTYVALAVALVASTACASALGTAEPGRVGAIPPSVPTLRNAAALGALVRVDPKRRLAEFRISCGWYYKPKRRVHRRLWKVDLRHLTFGWESNLSNAGAGHVETVSLKTWEHRSELRGWSGTLRLTGRGGNLSNGPTTDICAGSLG
jgi:hypothetical protein